MIRNVFRLAVASFFVAGAMMVSVGCDGSGSDGADKTKVDTSAPPKAPAIQKVEPFKKK